MITAEAGLRYVHTAAVTYGRVHTDITGVRHVGPGRAFDIRETLVHGADVVVTLRNADETAMILRCVTMSALGSQRPVPSIDNEK